LLSKRSEPTTAANNADGLARSGTRLLQALVDGDTGAENWGDGRKVDVLGDAGCVCCLGDGVLLEGAINRVS